MYAPIHRAGPVFGTDHSDRCDTLNVHTIDIAFFASFGSAERADCTVPFLLLALLGGDALLVGLRCRPNLTLVGVKLAPVLPFEGLSI